MRFLFHGCHARWPTRPKIAVEHATAGRKAEYHFLAPLLLEALLGYLYLTGDTLRMDEVIANIIGIIMIFIIINSHC